MTAVLFDLDGTLVDSLAGIHATTSAVLEERGQPPLRRAMLRGLVGAPLESIFVTLVPGLSVDESLAYAARYRELYGTVGVPHTPLFPGIESLLQDLTDARIKLAVVTTKRSDAAVQVLDAARIATHFRAVIGGDSTPHTKPHPAPARAALAALAATPDEASVVGDTTFDIEMARAAGCRPIAVRWGYGSPASLRKAGANLHAGSVDQLRALLLDPAA